MGCASSTPKTKAGLSRGVQSADLSDIQPKKSEAEVRGTSQALTTVLQTPDAVVITSRQWDEEVHRAARERQRREGEERESSSSNPRSGASLNIQTSRGSLTTVSADFSSALQTLGVNVDNGSSHMEDVKAIIRANVVLGAGSYGTVYKGMIAGIPVALKVLQYKEIDAVRDELFASMSLHHPNLVQTYMAFQQPRARDDGPDEDDPFADMMTLDLLSQREKLELEGPLAGGGYWEEQRDMETESVAPDDQVIECYIVQEYCNMGDLKRLITDGSVSGPTHLKRCVMMVLDIARGLAHMHKYKVLHLDLKPQNILLSRKPSDRPVCKIADFGVSRAMPADMATVNTNRCGTAVYAPVEMVMDGKVSPTADVYSLALIMGEMLAGQLLYKDMSMAQAVVAVVNNGLRPELGHWVPGQLRDLLCKAWSPNRADRPSAQQFAQSLRQVIKVMQ